MIKYPKRLSHREHYYYAEIHENTLRYGNCILYNRKNIAWGRAMNWGVIKLEAGWQDMDRTYTAQDIYWIDKIDCRIMQREAA